MTIATYRGIKYDVDARKNVHLLQTKRQTDIALREHEAKSTGSKACDATA